MYSYRIIEQVKRKPKAMTGILKKMMIFFAIFFILLGIMVSQGFMLPGFLLVLLYFFYSVLSQKEYEYVLEGGTLTIDVILGGRYRHTAHVLELHTMEVAAPSRHEAVAKYRKGTGTERLVKYDYTSYEEDTPYYTMIIMENRQKIKLLLDLSGDMLEAMKKSYPDRVFLS
ncbi:MAG: hypothetical protein K2N87_10955 [Eubacterium sp.]|nr:hypothetical protein [Eubacterium sp.]